ncbi:MAG: hypothetical protein HKM98_06865 [Gammaproteobacteria bacterium]|nr:hypothetical protein [Gammaproteobacteria bacterium]
MTRQLIMISDSDLKFRDSVEDCSWPGPFGHTEHIRLAWIYLRELPTDEAIGRCSRALRGLAESHGDFEKYHETLTVALLRLIASTMAAGQPDESWENFRSRATPLFSSARELLAEHYSPGRLEQEEARKSFLPPDRAPF